MKKCILPSSWLFLSTSTGNAYILTKPLRHFPQEELVAKVLNFVKARNSRPLG
jgi:hypothetical protein